MADDLIKYIVDWARKNEFDFIINCENDNEEIDFININLNTKTIYVGDLNITEPLIN